ncbi:MAG: DUF4921 family protein [Acidimicrobiia bacterium]|nr:DUF4921 family protein [Acidimicrobiia bacterium]
MPELRHDPVTDRPVLVAPERAGRPHTTRWQAEPGDDAGGCPFCPGHEHMTPPEVLRTGEGAPDTPGWRIRVFPNLYPMVGGEQAGPGATGAHEVVVFDPDHRRSLATLPEATVAEVLAVWRARIGSHLGAGRRHVQAIVNHGRRAGASIDHPHAQLVALDLVPPAIGGMLDRFARARTDLVADQLAEAGEGVLGVLGGPAPAWCPYASALPYEVRVTHRDAGARFDEAGDREVAEVAASVRDVLGRIQRALGDVPYNLLLFTAPRDAAGPFRWFVEIQPRTTILAGFELGTGVYVNTVLPELAARTLREAEP